MRRLLVVLFLAAAGCGNPWPAPQAVVGDAPQNPAPTVETATPLPDDDPDLSDPGVAPPKFTISAPADGGAWPARFAPAPPPVEGKAVALQLEYGFHPMVVSPESGRFVIAQVLGRRVDKSHNNGTRFVLGDVVAGKVLKQWETPGHFEPLDLSPDGTRFVAKSLPFADRTLTVFTVGADFSLSRATVAAHFNAAHPKGGARNDNDLYVRWAGFLGNTRVASATGGGQVSLFDAATLARVGTFAGTAGVSPCATPDRKQLVAHSGGQVVLIDPAEGKAVGAKPLPLPAGPANLAVRPDGAALAAATPGRVRFLAVKTGETQDQVIPGFGDNGMPPGKFAWCGPGFLVHNRKVYDPGLSYMVWHLTHQSHADACSSRQVWAASRLPGEEAKSGPPLRVAVRAHAAVPPNLAEIVAAAKTRPNIYLLPAGAAVRVDAAQLPAAKQAAAKAELEQILRTAGYVTAAAAPAVFTMTLDPATTKTTTFPNLQNVPYTHQPLRIQFRHEGRVVLERVRVKTPPRALSLTPPETLAARAAAEGWGQPDYELNGLSIPPHVPGPAFPREGFGVTELSPDGPLHRGGR